MHLSDEKPGCFDTILFIKTKAVSYAYVNKTITNKVINMLFYYIIL